MRTTISNKSKFIFNLLTLFIVKDSEKSSYSLNEEVKIKPNETAEVTYKLLLITANKGDKVTVKVKLGATEAVKQIPIS